MDVKLGEVGEALFVAENRSDRPVTATAVFNVAPLEIGAYFNSHRMMRRYAVDAYLR